MVKEDENFLRVSLLLLKGGTLVSKETLYIEVNKSGKTIDVLLKPFEKKLYHKTLKKQREKLFPQCGTGTNIEVWDIAMLVTVLLTVFKNSLDDDQKDHLKTIKTIRDEVYAHNPSSSLSNDDYDDIRGQLEKAYLYLSSSIGNDKKNECDDIIKECTNDPFSHDDLKRHLENQEDLFQVVLDKMKEQEKSIREMKDAILARLDSMERKEDRSIKQIKVIDTELTLSGAVNEKDDIDFAERIVTTIINKAIRKAGGDKDDYPKIRKVVEKMLEDIKDLPEVEVLQAVHKCIILKFECRTYAGLHSILVYLHSDAFRSILKELAVSLNTIPKLKGKQIKIDADLTLECLKNIVDTLNSETSDRDRTIYKRTIRMPIEVKTEEGRRHLWSMFENGGATKRLNELSEAVFEELHTRITVTPSVGLREIEDAARQTGCSETTNEMGASNRYPLPTDLKDLEELDPKGFENYRKAFEKGDMSELKRHINEDIDKWQTIPVNIAVAGNTGVGKSSFINSFRGLKANSEGAAAVGLYETTDEPTKNMHPINKNIALWDLPGVGTRRYLKDTYLQKVNFDKYDHFLIIIATRFTENDIWLAKEVRRLGKTVFFIRTKMENDVINDKYENPKDVTVNKVRLKMLQHVANAGLEGIRVFLIDNHFPLDYDFPDLIETMINEVPIWKQEAMTLTMTNLTESLIHRKEDALQKRIMIVAIGSAIGGAIPLPGLGLLVNVAIISGEIRFYRNQLGLDDDSLRENARTLNTTVEHLKADLNIHSHLLGGSAKAIAAFVSKLVLSGIAALITSIVVPVFGSVIGATTSYSTTVAVLRSILNAFVSDALAVNKRLMHKLSAQSVS